MLSVPYTAIFVFGFLIYRGCKKNEEYRRALAERGDDIDDPAAS